MDVRLQFGVGLILTVTGWLLPRHVAGTRLRCNMAVLLDLLIPLLVWLLVLSVTARPMFAGGAVATLCIAFALGDKAKRALLREPVVFSDLPQFIQVFRHPRLIVPLGARGSVFGSLAFVVILFLFLFVGEPRVWSHSLWPAILVPAMVAILGCVLINPPLLQICGRALKEFEPQGMPTQDAARLGPLAMLIVYGVIARTERDARRAAVAAPFDAGPGAGSGAPVVLVQCESFFDARRLHPSIPQELLSAFDACCNSGRYYGRLVVPGWGANTTRTEFAALTGLCEDALGLDRFNPYYAFARTPIPSLAWGMRARGYRTICIHPFDPSFFKRHQIMPNLGFDTFLSAGAFAGGGAGGAIRYRC